MGIYSHEEQTCFVPLIETDYGEYQDTIVSALSGRRLALEEAFSHLTGQIQVLTEVAILLVETLRSGHKVLVAGNGGSAAEAQHFAAELVGRFKQDRAAYAAISLTTDTSILTAVANDYGFQDIFARQVSALGQRGDLFIAFSTSGESENLVRAALVGQQAQMKIVAVTGERASSLENVADKTIHVLGNEAATVQELHMVVTHILCEITETQLTLWENKLALAQNTLKIEGVGEKGEWQ